MRFQRWSSVGTAFFLDFIASIGYGDVTVWTNGAGVGGATARVTDADGVTTTQTFDEPGVFHQLSGLRSPVFVNLFWNTGWRASASGVACQRGTSFGDGRVASLCTMASLDLAASFEPPGPTGQSLRVTGMGSGFGLSVRDDTEIHYALIAAPPGSIPVGFHGKTQDLVLSGSIQPDDVLFEFSRLNPGHVDVNELVQLPFEFGNDDLTLLVWIDGTCVDCPVPAVSTWGLMTLALLMMAVGTLRLRAARFRLPP